MAKNPVIQAISEALDRPEEWVWTGFRLNHKSGYGLWMANGRAFFSVRSGLLGTCRPRGLWRLWRKAVGCRDAVVARAFLPTTPNP